MYKYTAQFQSLCSGVLLLSLVACMPVSTSSPLPSSTPESSVSTEDDPVVSTSSVPSPEPTLMPDPLPSDEHIRDQARPQNVILDLTLNNIASEFSAYYGASLVVEREGEGVIHEQSFFPSTELSKNLRFQPGDLVTGQKFTVHITGRPDGNCLDGITLGLKPEQSSTAFLGTSAYRQAVDWEILLNTKDFARLQADLTCLIGYTLEGRIKDEEGEPLEGVSVLAEITDDEKMLYKNLQITAEPGLFSLGSLISGATVSLSFSKPGYRSFQTYFTEDSGASPKPLEIILKRL